jgi:hypothetical protein
MTTMKSKLILPLCLCALCFSVLPAFGDKTCPGATCSVPSTADCSTYSEWIVTGTLTGDPPITHSGVVLATFTCPCTSGPNAPSQQYKYTYGVATTLAGSLSFTATVTASVTAGIGANLIGKVDGTLGVSTGMSVTGSHTFSQTTTMTAEWDPWSACVPQTSQLVATWVSGSWAQGAYVGDNYFDDQCFLCSGTWVQSTCDSVTGNSTASSKYTNWGWTTPTGGGQCWPCS